MSASTISAVTAGAGEPSVVQTWLEAVADKAIQVAIIAAGAVVVWVIGRLLIRALTRSIATGLPLSRRARKAIAKAIREGSVDADDAGLAEARRTQRAGTIRAVLTSTLAVVIVAAFVVMLLDLAGVPIAPLLASAGIVGVALGFGAQSLVKDVLAGFFMLVEDQYGVGDVVNLGEADGVVEEVGLRVTRLRSLDGTVWFVPNGEITRVGNLTKLWSRALIEVRLDYATDLAAATQALLDALAAARAADPAVEAAVLADGEVPGIEAFDYDAVVLRLLIRVRPSTQWIVARAVREQIRRLFAERGIQFAVPDHTLYLDATHPAKTGAEGGEATTGELGGQATPGVGGGEATKDVVAGAARSRQQKGNP